MAGTLFGIACLGLMGRSAKADPVGYKLDITTLYMSSNPANLIGGGSVGGLVSDTGFFQVKNNGISTFTGTIGDVAVAEAFGDQSFSKSGVTLHPGEFVTVGIGIDQDSSDIGGFNGDPGMTQNGVQMFLNGTVSNGVSSESVNLSIFDKDVHSGVPRTNPFGATTDAYVLQGGDPTGQDTGDPYETSQAAGQAEFFEAGPVVPEGSSLVMLAFGGLPLLVGLKRFRKRQA
jgi:hypothetical protein